MPDKTLQNGNNHSNKGAALFLVLVVITSLSVFGGVLMLLSDNRMLMAGLEIDSAKALSLAEAGIAQAIFEIKTQIDKDKDGYGNIKPTALGSGVYFTSHKASTQDIISTGEVNGVKRTIQIKYALN